MQAGYSVANDAIAYETSDSQAAQTYVNVIAVYEGNEEQDSIKALVEVLKSDEIKDYINSTYDGAVIPFEDGAEAEEAEAATEAAEAETEAAETEAVTEAAE